MSATRKRPPNHARMVLPPESKHHLDALNTDRAILQAGAVLDALAEENPVQAALAFMIASSGALRKLDVHSAAQAKRFFRHLVSVVEESTDWKGRQMSKEDYERWDQEP